MQQAPDFISIDPLSDKKNLIEIYEKETDTTIYPGQDTNILINLIAYYGNLVKEQVNQAAKLNLVKFSRYPIIDFLGANKKCQRLTANKGECTLKIYLNTTFSYPITINKGFLVKTSDGKYIFETEKSITFESGEKEKTVKIVSQEATSEVNKYGIGEINTVISSSFSYIEKVENITVVEGGSEDETDEKYAERIIEAPEGFSVAGPESAYKYFAKSAHSSIVAVEVEVPNENATVAVNQITEEMTVDTIENDLFLAAINYQTGELKLTLKQDLSNGTVIATKIPHPYKINIYVLTETGIANKTILDLVEEKLNNVRPLCDFVNVKSAEIKNFVIKGKILIKKDAVEEIVKNNVITSLNEFLQTFKNSLNKEFTINSVIKTICSVDGVHDFIPSSEMEKLPAKKNVAYLGEIGVLTLEKVDHD
jgi:phage-related baseplate assembly protein